MTSCVALFPDLEVTRSVSSFSFKLSCWKWKYPLQMFLRAELFSFVSILTLISRPLIQSLYLQCWTWMWRTWSRFHFVPHNKRLCFTTFSKKSHQLMDQLLLWKDDLMKRRVRLADASVFWKNVWRLCTEGDCCTALLWLNKKSGHPKFNLIQGSPDTPPTRSQSQGYRAVCVCLSVYLTRSNSKVQII